MENETQDRPDGFRPRKVRPTGWYERLIASGEVRAPGAPDPDEGKDYSGATVVNPPVATIEASGVR